MSLPDNSARDFPLHGRHRNIVAMRIDKIEIQDLTPKRNQKEKNRDSDFSVAESRIRDYRIL
jgi:hypothetical protein